MHVSVGKLFLRPNLQLSVFQAQIWCQVFGRRALSQTEVTCPEGRVRRCWEVPTWVFRLRRGSANKPLLGSWPEGKWLDLLKESQQVKAMATVSLAGAALTGDNFQSRALTSSGVILFRFLSTCDFILARRSGCILSWERICFIWKLMTICPGRGFIHPIPPTFRKSLCFWGRHSWRSGEYPKLGVADPSFWRSCQAQIA